MKVFAGSVEFRGVPVRAVVAASSRTEAEHVPGLNRTIVKDFEETFIESERVAALGQPKKVLYTMDCEREGARFRPLPVARDYSRDDLIQLCEKSIIPEEKWIGQSSPKNQRRIGECWALLKAGCEYYIEANPDFGKLSVTVYARRPVQRGNGHITGEVDPLYFYLPMPEMIGEQEGDEEEFEEGALKP